MTNADVLVGICDGCNAPNALYNPKHDQHECPKCGALYELGNTARTHLTSLLTTAPVLSAWLTHYKSRGLGQLEASEIVGDVIEKVLGELWEKHDG